MSSDLIIKHYRDLGPESILLDNEAQKMGVHRKDVQRGHNVYTETDWSLIYRMYCVWANKTPTRMWF